MNYATIKKTDVANGPGVRVSLFVSGCTHHCKGCFNSVAWDFQYGQAYTLETEQEILQALAPDYIRGLSLLGGEPMEPENQHGLLELAKRAKALHPEKSIWCYTGDIYEDLVDAASPRHTEETDELLGLIDVLVDGPYIDSLHDITLRFRGSSNQRVIDMNETRKTGEVVLWKDEEVYSTHSM